MLLTRCLNRLTESVILEDPHIQSVVLFGRGKFQVGVIVEPKAPYAFDPVKDEAKLEEFRNLIWPSVERMNALAPQHGRLFKEVRFFRSSHSRH